MPPTLGYVNGKKNINADLRTGRLRKTTVEIAPVEGERENIIIQRLPG